MEALRLSINLAGTGIIFQFWGNTYPVKDTLKAAGLMYEGDSKSWEIYFEKSQITKEDIEKIIKLSQDVEVESRYVCQSDAAAEFIDTFFEDAEETEPVEDNESEDEKVEEDNEETKPVAKFNKSEIMTKAWEMFKSTVLTFSECLKRVWANAKQAVANAALIGIKFVDGMDITVNGYTRVLNRWTKNGHDRVYINGGSRKGDGYVDLKTGYVHTGSLSYQTKIAEIILAMEF